MPASANITTAGVVAFTLPQGAWGVRIANESDTLIRRLLGAPAGTSGASLGIPIAAGASETIVFDGPLRQKLDVCAIHEGSGSKTLTYEVIAQPTAGGGVKSNSGSSYVPPTPLDASTNPNYPAAEAGDRYVVTVAGKVGGASGKVVEVGDVVEAIADNAGGTEAAVGSSWIVFQTNITVSADIHSFMQAADKAAARAVLGVGSSISLPLQAWIETSANGGDDTTGTVGDPSKPYANIAAAITDGARMMNLGAGTFAGYDDDFGAALDLAFRGLGPTRSIVTTLRNRGRELTVRDLGVESVNFTTISTQPAAAVAGVDGASAGPLTVQNVIAQDVIAVGAVGGIQNGDGNGYNGGNGNTVYIIGSLRASTVTTDGGSGSDAFGANNDSGGTGGNAGNVQSIGIDRPILTAGTVSCQGGVGGAPVNDGYQGAAGLSNGVAFLEVRVTTLQQTGSNTSGGYLDRVSGYIGTWNSSGVTANGDMTDCHFLTIGEISNNGVLSSNATDCSHLFVKTVNGVMPGGTMPCSNIAGVDT